MSTSAEPALTARVTAYRRSGFAAVTVYRRGRIKRYRASLRRYAALREWTLSDRYGCAPFTGRRSGSWMRHGIDVYYWDPA